MKLISEWLRKASDFKSLQVNCWKIKQAASKYKMEYLDKTCKKRSKTEKMNKTTEFFIFKLV